VSEINGPGDDLILPFIFVPHGGPEPPELAEYKANHPGWFTIPATYEPHEGVRQPDEAPPPPPPSLQDLPGRWGRRCEPPNHARRWASNDLAAASQAFQQANALHGDPVAALRSMRDSPERFADGAPPAQAGGTDGNKNAGIGTPSAGPNAASLAVEKEQIGIDADE